METLAHADPWASMRAVRDDDEEDARAVLNPSMTRTTRVTTRRGAQKTRMGDGRASTPREDEDEDEEEDEEEAAMTASEGEEEETMPMRHTRSQRKTVKFREEAEKASLTAMAKRRRAPATPTPGKKVAVREEVEKINARTSGPLAARTNEKGMRDARETTTRESADDSSFATADPWGAPPPSERKSRRARDEHPPSPNRYAEPAMTTPKKVVVKAKKKTTKEPVSSSPQRAFGSPTAIVSPARAPLRADTAEGRAYVCPGPPIPPERECYLGLWRGEERARLLAYEACVQTCLDGSTGSFAGQSRFDVDTWLFFLNDRCAKLREAFGLENVLVSTTGQQCATPEMKPRPTPEKDVSAETATVGAGAGGVRWAAITVSVVAVDIIDRGLKRITGGWDPREHGWKGKPNEPRGQNVIVRTEGGPGSAEVSARLRVKQAPERLQLGPGDAKCIIEVPLKASKIAKAAIDLDELCKKSDSGVVELPLLLSVDVPATEQAPAYERVYEKGVVKIHVVFEAAVGAGLMSAPPGAGTAPDRRSQGWAEINRVLTPQGAYDFALGAALRSLAFTRRRLAIRGEWKYLLVELSRTHGVSESYTSLRYIQHLLAVATPTADCLSLIRDHLKLALRRQADGSLGATEAQMLNGIRVTVMTLVCVCFANYKSLDESQFKGITESIPPIVPAPALEVSLELFKALQRDPTAASSTDILVKNITSAAKACFKKNSAVLVSEKRKLAVNNKDLVTQLYVAIGELCVALRHELDIDRTIQHASDFPSNFSLPAITAEVYSTDVAATFQDALAACPPRGPPTTDILDCIDRACNLQASVAVEEKEAPRTSASCKLDTRAIFQPHIDGWIADQKKRLETRCVAVFNAKGVVGAAVEEAYIAMNDCLNGFERIVTRWPDQALALEEVLVGAERLLIRQIAETVEHLHVGIATKEETEGKAQKQSTRKNNWINISRMKEGVNTVAKRTQQLSSRLSRGDSTHYGIPPPLAAALNALKSMEIRRAEEDKVGQRLMSWATKGGGAGAEELGRGLTETLGELRAHFNGYLRRAVEGLKGCAPSLREKLRKAKPNQEVQTVVSPILAYIDNVKPSLDKKLRQRRAMLGVLRGLWDSIGAECLTFYEEDLRTNSTWHKRVLASAAVDCVSEKMEETIREFLGHDAQERDVEPPQSVAKLQAFSASNTRSSVQLY